MRKRKLIMVLIAQYLSVCLFIGCNPIDESKSVTTFQNLTNSPILVPSSSSTATVTTLPTITDTPIPETPTHTVGPSLTPTWTATWTPVPTLSEEVRKQNLITLFTTNGGCEYPCFWGVTPGESFQQVFSLSPLIGKSPNSHKNLIEYGITLGDLNVVDFSIDYYEMNGLVEKIRASLSFPERLLDYMDAFRTRLSISSILFNYGQPSHVLLQIQPRVEKDSPIGYTLYMLYIQEGFAIMYDGVVNSEKPITACVFLEDYHLRSIGIELQDSKAMESLRDELIKKKFMPIDDVTAMSMDEFFQIFSSIENEQCIETSIDYWK